MSARVRSERPFEVILRGFGGAGGIKVRKPPTITNIISPALRRHMREIDAPVHFLLLLRPGVATIDFIAVDDIVRSEPDGLDEYKEVMDRAFAEVFEEIKGQGAKGFKALSNTTALFALCHEVVTAAQKLAPHLNLDEQRVRAVAVRWLEQELLPLGDAPPVPEGAERRWRSRPANQAQLRFQDAIDWYAGYRCSIVEARLANDGERYEGYEEFGVGGNGNTILKVPMSASRPNIVTFANLKVFLAEHLLAYDKFTANMHASQAGGFNADPGLTFFFLPIKGLSQYRAAMDWVGVDGYKLNSLTIQNQLERQASKLQRLGLESLFSQSLIRSFGASLQQAFFVNHKREGQPWENLYQAFADLWWATEVRFSKAGQLQHRLVRGESEEDMTWVTPADRAHPWSLTWDSYPGAYTGFLATAGAGHPELTYIKLNLASLVDPTNYEHGAVRQALEAANLGRRELESVIGALPFDEVIFACHFFQPHPDDLAEWVDQLADVILGVLIEQTIQRSRVAQVRAKSLERAAHWLNGIMRSAGRAAAAEELATVLQGLNGDNPYRAELENVYNTLQLMALVEAGTGLLRLYGTIDEEDYAHVAEWFTESSKAEWTTEAAFQKYHDSILHLIRAVACARGHKRVTAVVGGRETHYEEGCTLNLDDLLFPPLSKQEKGNEPILALMPALTEPLDNALNYLYKKRLLGTNAPIRLHISDLREDGRRSGILVEIGNPYFEGDELPSTPGLDRAQELMRFTGLATIGGGRIEKVGGEPYYFVRVQLHPQRLAEQVDSRMKRA